MAAKHLLRELPGVAEFEARLALMMGHADPQSAPQRLDLVAEAEVLSIGLFGIGAEATWYRSDPELSSEEDTAAWVRWEENFACLHIDDDCQEDACEAFWEALGWDVTDADGMEMFSLDYLGRQLICANKGLAGHMFAAAGYREITEVEQEEIVARIEADATDVRRAH